MTVVMFRSIFFYNYVYWNVQKKLWYILWSNVCFIAMQLRLTLTVLILILHLQNSHWDSTSNRTLTSEIKVLGCPRDLMPVRILFLKFKVIIFLKLFHRFTGNQYQSLPFAFCENAENIIKYCLQKSQIRMYFAQ